MSLPFSTNQVLCDWLSVNYFYSFSLSIEIQKQIMNTVLSALKTNFKAVVLSQFNTAYQLSNFIFININKRFLQIQFQGKYFLENEIKTTKLILNKIKTSLERLEKIELRKDTEINLSISRLDIQKTYPFQETNLLDIGNEFKNLKSFKHLIYAQKSKGIYQVIGETIKDLKRWKIRLYNKTIQVQSEYSQPEQDLFYKKYPSISLERLELQITDTPFLNQFLKDLIEADLNLVEVLKKWNTTRKIRVISEALIGSDFSAENSSEIFKQENDFGGLCKAPNQSILDNLKDINTWIDKDPLAKPVDIIKQVVFCMGYDEQVAEEVKKIFFKI
jgi:hypothetical protein